MPSILLVEDTPSLALLYSQVLSRAGHKVATAMTLADARAHMVTGRPQVVLLDLQLPDGDGLDLLDELQHRRSGERVIVITANGSINRAVEAMRAGAFDFLVKPFDENRLLSAVQNAASTTALVSDEAETADTVEAGLEGFIGRSPAMQDIYRMVRSIGHSTATVFITGESGTGKDVCARAIHAVSARRNRPFVPLNCAAIPRDLLESEVFGHLKGAFTGALSDKPGAAAVANGGTLFLDEICEMDLSLQTKLLRFLQTSTIQPVGAAKAISVDVRIVCATNRDPAEEVRQGRFREDLFYRLHVVPIHMPPLRGRGEDILDIARSSLAEFAAEEQKAFTGFDAETLRILASRPWPGNVRQLLNVIRNVVVLHDGTLVTRSMLPPEVALAPATEPPVPLPMAGRQTRDQSFLHLVDTPPEGERPIDSLVGNSLAVVERALIEATIERCGGSIPRAARMLELSPSTIYRKLEGWQVPVRRIS